MPSGWDCAPSNIPLCGHVCEDSSGAGLKRKADEQLSAPLLAAWCCWTRCYIVLSHCTQSRSIWILSLLGSKRLSANACGVRWLAQVLWVKSILEISSGSVEWVGDCFIKSSWKQKHLMSAAMLFSLLLPRIWLILQLTGHLILSDWATENWHLRAYNVRGRSWENNWFCGRSGVQNV